MLVLTRENNEEIDIMIPEGFSGRIKIAYLGLYERQRRGKTVVEGRIGISAPNNVTIIRSELEHVGVPTRTH